MVTGMFTCTALYLMTAVAGYWAYGDTTESPVYNSLQNEKAKLISMIVMTVHVVLAIPIYTTSFALEFENWAIPSQIDGWKAWCARAVIRTCIRVF